jgi:hypothetical protein
VCTRTPRLPAAQVIPCADDVDALAHRASVPMHLGFQFNCRLATLPGLPAVVSFRRAGAIIRSWLFVPEIGMLGWWRVHLAYRHGPFEERLAGFLKRIFRDWISGAHYVVYSLRYSTHSRLIAITLVNSASWAPERFTCRAFVLFVDTTGLRRRDLQLLQLLRYGNG